MFLRKFLPLLFLFVSISSQAAPIAKTDLLGEWNVVIPSYSDFQIPYSDFEEMHYSFSENGDYRALCSTDIAPLFLSECGKWKITGDSLVLSDCCYSRNWSFPKRNSPIRKSWKAEKKDSSIFLYAKGSNQADIILQRSNKQLWMSGKQLNEINFLFAGFAVDTFVTNQVISLYPDTVNERLVETEMLYSIQTNRHSAPYIPPPYFYTYRPDHVYLQAYLDSSFCYSGGLTLRSLYLEQVIMTWTFVGKKAKHRAAGFYKAMKSELKETGLKSFSSSAGVRVLDSTGRVLESGKGEFTKFFDDAATVPPEFYLDYEPDFNDTYPDSYLVTLHWSNLLYLGDKLKEKKK